MINLSRMLKCFIRHWGEARFIPGSILLPHWRKDGKQAQYISRLTWFVRVFEKNDHQVIAENLKEFRHGLRKFKSSAQIVQTLCL